MNNNDERVLKLKKQIEEKKNKLKEQERYNSVTTNVFHYKDETYNLNVLGKDSLIDLLVRLNMIKLSVENLKIENYKIGGFTLSDWMQDIKYKIDLKNRKIEEEKLRVLENKLDKLLSDDKKVELELDNIEDLLK